MQMRNQPIQSHQQPGEPDVKTGGEEDAVTEDSWAFRKEESDDPPGDATGERVEYNETPDEVAKISLHVILGGTKNAALERLLDRDYMEHVFKQKEERNHDHMRNQANRKGRDVTYDLGEYAFIKFQPYRSTKPNRRRFEKWSPTFFGPCCIKRRVGQVVYESDIAHFPNAGGKPPNEQPSATFRHFTVESIGRDTTESFIRIANRLEDKSNFGVGCIDTIPPNVGGKALVSAGGKAPKVGKLRGAVVV